MPYFLLNYLLRKINKNTVFMPKNKLKNIQKKVFLDRKRAKN